MSTRLRLLIGAVCVLLVVSNWTILSVFPLAILYGVIVLPGRNPLAAWPFGMLLLQAVVYVIYIFFWIIGVPGISYQLAQSVLVLLSLVGVLLSREPQERKADQWTYHSTGLLGVVLLLVIGLFAMAVVRPSVLINAHLGGGDHSNHVGFAYSLISHVNRAPLPSPITATGYAHATHFFVALISAGSIRGFDGTVLGLVFRDYAVFDLLVLFAIAQVGAGLVTFDRRTPRLVLLLATVPTLLLLKMPDLLGHFWLSGFSTSLFALFVLVASVGASLLPASRRRKLVLAVTSSFVLLGVYQPFAIVPLLVWVVGGRTVSPAGLKIRLAQLAASILIPLTAVFAVGFVSGKTGTISATLMRDGASLTPSTALFWIMTGTSAITLIAGRNAIPAALTHLSTVSLTCGFWLLSRWLGAGGEVVYYVKKLVWTSNALGALVIGMFAVYMVLELRFHLTPRLFMATSLSSVIVTTFLVGVNPLPRLSFVNGEWFVSQLLSPGLVIDSTAIALNPSDMFTSHLANVALSAASEDAHQFDLALLSGASTRDLCALSSRIGVKQLFTARGQRALLLENGCGADGQIVVD